MMISLYATDSASQETSELVARQLRAIWCDLDRPMWESRRRTVQRYTRWLSLGAGEARAEALLFDRARQLLHDDDRSQLDQVEREVLEDGISHEELVLLLELAPYLAPIQAGRTACELSMVQ